MDTWACSTCGGENPAGTRFCGHCGAAADAPWTCASCGGENPDATRFCGHCGSPAPGVQPPAPPPASPPPAPAPASASDDDHQKITEALKSFVAPAVAKRLLEGGALPDERRLITSLFADVSGFTPLSELLDPEQLVEVIDPLITSLSEIVGRYEGTVDKYAGDAILALFGAPINHEDDAERALLVALDMHREIVRLRDELPHGELLGLHIGVNSGHAIARVQGSQVRLDYNVLGDAVNLAQRLESVAPLGETYVSEATYNLAKHRFEFESVGELTLKGKTEPVPGWRLVGERTSVERRHRPLVGRSAEVATLTDALDGLDRGNGAVVVLSGEAGVGKSRLTSELQDLAAQRGVRWLFAHCLSYGSAVAYMPFTDLLRQEPDLTELASADERPYLARMLGEPAPELDQLEPEAFRRGLHSALASVLRTQAESQPVVLAIEDVHWADPSSLGLCEAIAAECADRPMLLYLITRPDALAGLGALTPTARTIELGPFGEKNVEELIAAMLDAPAPASLAGALMERTGGNPLFVEELVASLLETGVLTREGDGWTVRESWDALSLPTSIEKVLAARIDLLPRPTAAALQEASVIGRRMRIELLTAVAAEIADIEAHVASLVERGFLDPITDEDGAPAAAFHHALIVEVAYGRLLRRTRSEMHLRVARVVESLYGTGDGVVDLLAQHYYLGGAAQEAVPYLLRAGSRAAGMYANDEAIQHFSRAVELAPDSAEARLGLADLFELVGRYEEALTLFREVRDSAVDVRAWLGTATTLRKRGEYAEALAAIDEAYSTQSFDGEALTALQGAQARTLEVSGQVREAADVLRDGLAAAGERRDATVGHLLFQLARALTILGDHDAAIEHGLEAERIFDAEHDLRGLASTMRVLGDTYRYLGRFDEAAAALRRGLELAERVGNVEELGGCLINLGVVEASRGSSEEALACFRRAVEAFDAVGHASGRAHAYSNLAYMLTLVGHYDEALEYCDRALEVAQSIGHSMTIAQVYDTMAAIATAQGRFEEAVAKGEEAAAIHLEMGAIPDAVGALETAIAAAEKAGDTERARSLSERARSLTVAEPA